jgi:hypothetical protein
MSSRRVYPILVSYAYARGDHVPVIYSFFSQDGSSVGVSIYEALDFDLVNKSEAVSKWNVILAIYPQKAH